MKYKVTELESGEYAIQVPRKKNRYFLAHRSFKKADTVKQALIMEMQDYQQKINMIHLTLEEEYQMDSRDIYDYLA